MRFHPKLRPYLGYKFLNALFSGLSLSTIFIIYAPLEPIIYSIGGILLALGMWGVAHLYSRILNALYYVRILFWVEILPLGMIALFLLFPERYPTALLIYALYQLIFLFGSFLVRAETMIFRHKSVITLLDTTKQKGYLVGLSLSALFYFLCEQAGITAKIEQVYWLHFLLALNQLALLERLYQSVKGRSIW